MKDRDWKSKANPALLANDQRMEKVDFAMLEKRKK